MNLISRKEGLIRRTGVMRGRLKDIHVSPALKEITHQRSAHN